MPPRRPRAVFWACPPNWPAAGYTGTTPPPPATAALTATYGGTGFLNSGLLFKGSSATVTFTAAGTFGFICQIHPGMSGTVNVVAYRFTVFLLASLCLIGLTVHAAARIAHDCGLL